MDDRNVQQVWQRVRAAGEEVPKNDLRQLQREAMELAVIYRGLMPQFTGRQQEQARQLYLGEKANGAALAGIGILSHQSEEQLKLWQPGKEPVKKLLERCYHRARRCMTEYMARSAEPEFGVVFDRMARREGDHCLLLAQLLGELL
jgi:hypothetical protein